MTQPSNPPAGQETKVLLARFERALEHAWIKDCNEHTSDVGLRKAWEPVPAARQAVIDKFADLERELAAAKAQLAEARKEQEDLMLRSVAAMAIAEGEPEWETRLEIDCPMLGAVANLRRSFDITYALFHKSNIEHQAQLATAREDMKEQAYAAAWDAMTHGNVNYKALDAIRALKP